MVYKLVTQAAVVCLQIVFVRYLPHTSVKCYDIVTFMSLQMVTFTN